MIKRMILCLLLLTGCAHTGSRAGTRTVYHGEQVGVWSVEWWPGAKLLEQQWIREAVTEHDALARKLDPQLTILGGRLVCYETQADLQQAFVTTAQQNGGFNKVFSIVDPGLSTRLLFLDPFDLSIHVWLGWKLEGNGLTQGMLRVTYNDFRVNPLSAYWNLIGNEDYVLAQQIYGRR